MSYAIPVARPSYTSASAFSRGHVAVVNPAAANASVTQGVNATTRVVGLYLDSGAANDDVSVGVSGIELGVAGAAIANSWTALTCNGSGRLVAASTGNQLVGWNLAPAAADGDEIPVQLAGMGLLAP